MWVYSLWLLFGVSCLPSKVAGQHWWNFEDNLQPHITPPFTPLPNQRFTHKTIQGEFAHAPNDVIVNIPEAGLGNFVGFSQWVDYDYTWTEWPPLKGRLVNVFLGIPYAAPPLNDHRFRIPRPSYLDTRYTWFAKSYKPACMQDKHQMQREIPGFDDFSEDCLYLNIFYPNRTWEPPTKRYPVVVHIHGGSFMYGSSHLYPGHALASMGTVVVTFNYRLGPLGFLATGDFASTGNYGLWDQLEAMTWVRDNIWWFKGDPRRITLMGESAGAASVGLQLVSPVSRGRDLFQQAIMMSGSDMSPWAVSDPEVVRSRHYAKELGKILGCPTADAYSLVYCLRYYTDTETMVSTAYQMGALRGAPDEIWTPVVDGSVGFLPRSAAVERAQGRFDRLPIIVGVVHDEGSRKADYLLKTWKNWTLIGEFTDDMFRESLREFLKYLNIYRLEQTLDELYFRYTWWSNPTNLTARKEQFVAVLSDYFINSPADATMRYQAPYTDKAYFYEWAYRGLNDTMYKEYGIYHGVEIPFIFGFPFMNASWWKTLMAPNPPPAFANRIWNFPYDTNMSEFSMLLWTNFMEYGNPTPWEIQNVTWLPYTVEDMNYMHIYTNSSIRQKFRQSHLAFWRERYYKVAEPLPASSRYIHYPISSVEIMTFVLAVLLIIAIGVLIALIVSLCRRPDPDEFVHHVAPGGDKFSSAFKDTFAGYRGEESEV